MRDCPNGHGKLDRFEGRDGYMVDRALEGDKGDPHPMRAARVVNRRVPLRPIYTCSVCEHCE